MKNQKLPTASKLTIVRQLCNYIPIHLVPKLARETGVDEQARTFEEWSHIVTLCYAQVTHNLGDLPVSHLGQTTQHVSKISVGIQAAPNDFADQILPTIASGWLLSLGN